MLPTPENKLCLARSRLTGKNLAFYDSVVQAIKNGEYVVPLGRIDRNRALDIFILVMKDHPEFYWIASEASSGGVESQLELTAHLQPNANLELTVTKECERFGKLIAGIHDEYTKAKILFSEVATMSSYNQGVGMGAEQIKSHTIWGVFGAGAAVCDGFAAALQFTFQNAGIIAYRISGNATATGVTGPHSWVLARIDGSFYHFDATWARLALGDDRNSRLKPNDANYDYFCLTDAEIRKTHSAEETIALPLCRTITANYYRKERYFLQRWDVQAIVNMFAKQIASKRTWNSVRVATKKLYVQLTEALADPAFVGSLFSKVHAQLGQPERETYRYEYVVNETLFVVHIREV